MVTGRERDSRSPPRDHPRRAVRAGLRWGSIVGAAAFLVACYSLKGAGVFPCALDQTCPDDYVCKHGSCERTSSPCPGKQVLAFSTYYGGADLTTFCTQSCNGGHACPHGFTCVQQGDDSQVCIDCQTSSDCPSTQCCATWNGGEEFGQWSFGCQLPSAVASFSADNASVELAAAECTDPPTGEISADASAPSDGGASHADCDQGFAGSWQRSSDLIILTFQQSGCTLQGAISNDPKYTQTLSCTASGTVATCELTRRNPAGCTTVVNVTYTLKSSTTLFSDIDGTDGRCDLSTNYTETSTFDAIN